MRVCHEAYLFFLWGLERTHRRDDLIVADQKIPEWSTEITFLGKVKTAVSGASLVVQWLRVCLLMQGTRVRALVWEDPTCRGATRPVSHNC